MTKPHAPIEDQYFVQGYDAFKQTQWLGKCPYAKYSYQYRQWLAGWRKALLESRKSTTEKGTSK